RVVEQDDPRRGRQPAADHDLLLVSARKAAHRIGKAAEAQRQPFDDAAETPGHAAAREAEAAFAGDQTVGEVLEDRPQQRDAVSTAVAGDIGEAGGDRLGRRGRTQAPTLDLYLAPPCRFDAEERPQQGRLALAVQPAETK